MNVFASQDFVEMLCIPEYEKKLAFLIKEKILEDLCKRKAR